MVITLDQCLITKLTKNYNEQELENDPIIFEKTIVEFCQQLKTHQQLAQAITNNGRVSWLNQQNYQNRTGLNSPLITALIAAYRSVFQDSSNLISHSRTEAEVVEKSLGIDSFTRHPTPYTLHPSEQSDDNSKEVIKIDKFLTYYFLSHSLRISFNDYNLAKIWGNYLRTDLYLCDRYSVEESLKENWKYELVIGNIRESEARILAEMTNFGIRPHENNPKNPD